MVILSQWLLVCCNGFRIIQLVVLHACATFQSQRRGWTFGLLVHTQVFIPHFIWWRWTCRAGVSIQAAKHFGRARCRFALQPFGSWTPPSNAEHPFWKVTQLIAKNNTHRARETPRYTMHVLFGNNWWPADWLRHSCHPRDFILVAQGRFPLSPAVEGSGTSVRLFLCYATMLLWFLASTWISSWTKMMWVDNWACSVWILLMARLSSWTNMGKLRSRRLAPSTSYYACRLDLIMKWLWPPCACRLLVLLGYLCF